MHRNKVRINWRQKSLAADKLVRVHKILQRQPKSCRFTAMREYKNYSDEQQAIKSMRQKGCVKYKRCYHCWDNKIIDISC